MSGEYASPPCFMHELDTAFRGGWSDSRTATDVSRWRRSERQRLLGLRQAVSGSERVGADRAIAEGLCRAMGRLDGRVVGLYVPIRGEPAVAGLARRILDAGGRCALPAVETCNSPLVYRAWTPGDPLEPGVWRIPCPSRDRDAVLPDIAVAPVVGFDPRCYRLGNGGGYFDRTLAVWRHGPVVLGAGYACLQIATIYPQPHDMPMHAVVTECATVMPS
ncbi:MAG: 5-formyltetrahydrofolate cyclo-ligase [Minwuia sp.]|uniref:5-formyltetrahydrofolate cyclo-ligase n=1 Tax=Minwuia sp. TaxID=2493630 RepID=UPI003A83E057